MAIRQIKGTELEQKRVLENLLEALSTRDEVTGRLWYSNHPCPIGELDGLYSAAVQYKPVREKSLLVAVKRLWQEGDLVTWLSRFSFFKITKVDGEECVFFAPLASDVLVDCWYQDRPTVCFEDVSPQITWNKCPSCGTVNSYEVFKYEIICSATAPLVSKWCSFFYGRNVEVQHRELAEHVCNKCKRCHFIDCPFAWKFGENCGGGHEKGGLVTFPKPQTSLQRFARFDAFGAFLSELKSLVEQEFWGGKESYLRNYVYMTFYNQLMHRDSTHGLQETSRFAWFNTGLLVRDTFEEVFICFRRDASGWLYDCITYKGASNGKYEAYSGVESMVPRYIPHYENSSELIWDVRLDLNWRQNFDHIFFDNILRILKCKSFVTGACGINIPPEYRELKSAIPFKQRESLKADGFYRDVLALFDNAVRQSLKKVIRNYKWVLPIYFPTGRMMSLALPQGDFR